jgi:hypothetical protein
MDLNLLDLPAEVLVMIVSILCYRALARLAQVSTKCRDIVRFIWQTESEIDFSQRAFIYETNHNNGKLQLSPANFLCMMESILKQTNAERLKKLDATFYCRRYRANQAFNEQFINTIVKYCQNINYLNLAGYILTYDSFNELPMNLSSLVHIDLRSSTINDYCLTYILNDCFNLQTINLNKCACLRGLFVGKLYRVLDNLKFLYIDDCDKLQEAPMIEFLNRHGNYLTGAFHSRSSVKLTNEFCEAVVKNLKYVQSLKLTCSEVKFSYNLHSLQHLTELDLSGSVANNNEISLVLNRCLKLKLLRLNGMTELRDDAFTMRPILSRLSALELHNARNLTDLSIQVICTYLARYLSRLNLIGCQLTSFGVGELLKECTMLDKLDLSDGIMDESFLEWLLENSESLNKVTINCHGCSKLQEVLSKKSNLSEEMFINKKLKFFNYNKIKFSFRELTKIKY